MEQSTSGYDAVVVGSGYGGSVAASRLSRMGLRVAVFERGRHWRPGDFPTTTSAKLRACRLTGHAPDLGHPTGLYYLSIGKGLTVFGASGLGGGSLINAGIALRPDMAWLRKSGWPPDVIDDGLLNEGFARAETMLGVAPVPEPGRFAKLEWMSKTAKSCEKPLQFPAMTITHKPGLNSAGVLQYACQHCGDCWSGCNVGAKNTTGVTYLMDATDHGASVFCESHVQSIAKCDAGWRIEVKDMSQQARVRIIATPILVLAAGTLGTNELLLKAQACGLPLSSKLGTRFSANGDDLMLAMQLATPVNAVATGFPSRAPRGTPLVGPHSAAAINLSDNDGPLWVHDGTMLTLMARLAPLKNMLQLDFRRALRELRHGIYAADLSRTQLLYVVAYDNAGGQLRLKNDRVCVDWSDYSDAPERLKTEQRVKAVIERVSGKFGANPFAMTAFGGNRIIAHPLGGAAMGETSMDGVVAPDGQVFDPSSGPTAVHKGLYVCDGAAIPSSVGVSPLLTISALAERAMVLLSRKLNRKIDMGATPMRWPRDALA
ncbi:MAG: GMC family oxidoreductase N-terminal domain-containing protein [Hyphomicrobium sp.]|nr:GMC family oxidoreductase N-terminal domain-containing protein [Hyphomicrobium sp.]